ncbi:MULTISPECIES: haloalkane dehalogenase [unclassified Streptomyces]|uniref:haloalkane dehalogenase n=1 Tax=unclassified Streptomyces TaxID=2593676 RepID=UPI00224EE537|nr:MULTISPECIES: haloalkane dehalogenase [unclassified Streptomyces]MCX4524468.1 haloalkane dehalogenase [Streptomyces sp. NBC_01551]MCX4545010.1 haloalkane dehalogenase [Streptomyces sp. NBC_01565]
MPVLPVLDTTMHHLELGADAGTDAGTPMVFLHGNPTSSHLWRDILPAVGGGGRRLAPDLIGMGRSGKPDIDYTFADQARHLDGWFDALGLDEVILIGHDWGGALAFDWAARHPGRVRGIAFTETIVKPMQWEEFPEGGRELFRAVKTHGVGEAMILDENAFVEEALPGTVATPLDPADLAAYRAPYPTRESRRPLLRWARSMPLGGEPAEVVARVEAYGAWLEASADVPKLLLTFAPGPGVMMGPELVAWCARNIAALEVEHHAVPAGHHTPEDQPALIAASLTSWTARHRLH